MSETRYAEIARELTEAIADGRFPVGSLLPTEIELSARYGASRHTVRAALGELQDAGLVSRRKRVGTRVEAARRSDGFRQSLASVEDLVQFGEAHRRDVQAIAEVVADRALAAELGCASGRRFLRVSSLRRTGEPGSAPVGWTDVYVDGAYADLGDSVRAAPDVLISHLIEQQHGRRVVEIRQDVEATLLSEAMAASLGAEAGAPALRIVRRYLDEDGEAFEISSTVHPAGRFTLSSRLKRQSA